MKLVFEWHAGWQQEKGMPSYKDDIYVYIQLAILSSLINECNSHVATSRTNGLTEYVVHDVDSDADIYAIFAVLHRCFETI